MRSQKPMTPAPKRIVRKETGGRGDTLTIIGADLVTEYDRAVENMISSSLKEKYPHYECVENGPSDASADAGFQIPRRGNV